MPQGRRKIPFSGKQKKQQLISKRQDKSFPINLIRKINDETSETHDSETSENSTLAEKIHKINMQPLKDPKGRSNRFVLQFREESAKEIRELKEQARQSLSKGSETDLELEDHYFDGYDFPVRPPWSYEMSRLTLQANEERSFFKYITALEKYHYDNMKMLSYCELNIETWRQLWRVIELSDIILVIVDVRYPTLLFPPALYKYCTEELKKKVIILLNKIDLVESTVVLAWKKYFEQKYTDIHVALFTSYPSYNLRGSSGSKTGLKIRRRRGKMKMAIEGAREVYEKCSAIVKNQVDLSSWQKKIQEEMSMINENNDEIDHEVDVGKVVEDVKEFDFEAYELYKNGVLTIGTVGFPNVGKSSVLNALMGKKVVSVSRTPGHTKHFQTIFLTEKVRLVDCPGLVFPSSTPKILQVLIGSFPIAQLKQPYASIKFLAERVDLPALLSLQHPDGDDEWSAMDICDAFALKRGFLTAKAARPDSYRAANSILRMALDGKITLSFKPKDFSKSIESLKNDLELMKIQEIQALGTAETKNDNVAIYSDSDDEIVEKPFNLEGKPIAFESKGTDGDDEDTESEMAATQNPFDLLNDGDE